MKRALPGHNRHTRHGSRSRKRPFANFLMRESTKRERSALAKHSSNRSGSQFGWTAEPRGQDVPPAETPRGLQNRELRESANPEAQLIRFLRFAYQSAN